MSFSRVFLSLLLLLSFDPSRAFSQEFKLHSFERQRLTDGYFSEGANAGDINGDGKMDVVSGPYWYEGPELGDGVKSAAAPQIGGQAFTVACRVETEQKETIILAHGGSALGYALHLKDGRVVFSVRTAADRVTEVQSEPIEGMVTIKASVAKDGTMTLVVGDQKAVTAKALFARQQDGQQQRAVLDPSQGVRLAGRKTQQLPGHKLVRFPVRRECDLPLQTLHDEFALGLVCRNLLTGGNDHANDVDRIGLHQGSRHGRRQVCSQRTHIHNLPGKCGIAIIRSPSMIDAHRFAGACRGTGFGPATV